MQESSCCYRQSIETNQNFSNQHSRSSPMADFEPIPEEILQSRRSSREMADKSPSGSAGHHNKESGKSKSRHNKRSKSSSSGDGGQHRINKSVGSKSSKSAVSSEPLINDLDPPPMMLATSSSGQGNETNLATRPERIIYVCICVRAAELNGCYLFVFFYLSP